MPQHPQVIVIGGGVIGAAIAHELTRRQIRVTVIDKGDIGHGCSYGNAGWLTPSLALPLPMPGMLLPAVKWLTDPQSPLYIQPRPSWSLIRWLYRFWRSMNDTQMRRAARALTELCTFSLEAYRQLDRDTGGRMNFQQRGLLAIALTDAKLQAAIGNMNVVAALGLPGCILDADAVRELEPAVTAPALAGGIHYPNEAHVEPLAAVQTLIGLAQQQGAAVLPHTELFSFETQGSRITALQTTRGRLVADQYILAIGTWSAAIARQLQLRVPILGGKGYGLVIDRLEPMPRIPLMLLEKKVAVTPRADSVRLAGTLELVDARNDRIDRARLQGIIEGSRAYLNVPDPLPIREIWRGLRPCTPDGVPIIGRPARYENLLLATGHQMIGLKSAPATARLAAELLTGESPTFNPEPFHADRF